MIQCGILLITSLNYRIMNPIYLAYQGETHSISEWARKLGISRATVMRRLAERPGDVPNALRIPEGRTRYSDRGDKRTAAAWAKSLGLPVDEVTHRLKHGETVASIRKSRKMAPPEGRVWLDKEGRTLSAWARYLGISRQAVHKGFASRGHAYLRERVEARRYGRQS